MARWRVSGGLGWGGVWGRVGRGSCSWVSTCVCMCIRSVCVCACRSASSAGVIGRRMKMEAFIPAIPQVRAGLNE